MLVLMLRWGSAACEVMANIEAERGKGVLWISLRDANQMTYNVKLMMIKDDNRIDFDSGAIPLFFLQIYWQIMKQRVACC